MKFRALVATVHALTRPLGIPWVTWVREHGYSTMALPCDVTGIDSCAKAVVEIRHAIGQTNDAAEKAGMHGFSKMQPSPVKPSAFVLHQAARRVSGLR